MPPPHTHTTHCEAYPIGSCFGHPLTARQVHKVDDGGASWLISHRLSCLQVQAHYGVGAAADLVVVEGGGAGTERGVGWGGRVQARGV